MRLFLVALAATTLCAQAKPGVETIATGFNRPLWVGAPAHVKDRLWVIEQPGKIWIVDTKTGKKQEQPFLDLTEQVLSRGNEQGLLGLAFAPDFEKTGRFYMQYVDKQQTTRIVRMTSTGPDFTSADPDSQEVLISFHHPYENHNGGWTCFGPDGMLYISEGDGGAGDDPEAHGQAIDTYLAKMLRIDVSPETGYKVPADNPFVGKEGAKPEIWAYGLRNPWRCSFDRKTGDLWIGDVGQNRWEEVDFMPKGKGAGANYGWRLREADKPNPNAKIAGPAPEGSIEPVYVYEHGGKPFQGNSITGGYLYRGPVKELEGRYIFADYQNRKVWSFVLKDGKAEDLQDNTPDMQPKGGSLGPISSFGEDNDGNLLIVDQAGSILKVVEK
jgi:glucose/arabinose dehydrogenase